jgi:hypothetical protein
MPFDIDGPHGLVISPDRRFYYVSLAHGQPYGSVWKYSVVNDAFVGRVTLGMFPATMDVTPDGSLLYAVNFNLHGDMTPSSVSVVSTGDMLEIARIETCTMPHGSRMNPAGDKHYSVCMMDEQLVEVDTQALKVSRHFVLTKGKEMGMSGAPMRMAHVSRCQATAQKRLSLATHHACPHGRSPQKTEHRCLLPAMARMKLWKWMCPAGLSNGGYRLGTACTTSL